MIDEKLVILYHVFFFHALFESELELRCSAIRPSTELHLPIIMYMPRSRLSTGMALKHRNAILLLGMCLPQIFCSYKSLRRGIERITLLKSSRVNSTYVILGQ